MCKLVDKKKIQFYPQKLLAGPMAIIVKTFSYKVTIQSEDISMLISFNGTKQVLFINHFSDMLIKYTF